MKPEDIPTRNNPEEYIKYKQGLMQHLIDIFKMKESTSSVQSEKIIYEGVVEKLEFINKIS